MTKLDHSGLTHEKCYYYKTIQLTWSSFWVSFFMEV
jgi:hypothetical protein